MPMVIAAVGAFAAGAAGVSAIAAGATGLAAVAAYASVAGAVLTGIGAITGKRDLMKIGAVLAIGGGIGSFVAGAASGGGAAASAAAEGAAEGASSAGYVNGADLASDAASGAGDAAANLTGAVASPVSSVNAPPILEAPGAPTPVPMAPTTPTPTVPDITPNADAGLMGRAQAAAGSGGELAPPPDAALARIADSAKGLNSNDLNAWWEKAKAAGGAVGKFIEKNPALVKIGGDMLASMYGPQAEALDYQKSLYQQAQARLNNPIRLTYPKG